MGSSPDHRSIGTPARDAGWPVDLLRAVWSEQRELLAERVGVIERAVSALEQDCLEEPLRTQAERAAHMLSGSIAIFGFQQASCAARELELQLADPLFARTTVARRLLSCLQQIHVGVR